MIAGVVAGGRPYAASAPTASPVAWYKMESIAGGTLVDETGAYNGTISSGTVVTGKVGSAIDFNGSSTVGNINNIWGAFPVGNTPFTVACWVKHDTPSGQMDIVDLFVYNFGGFRLVAESGVMYAQLDNGGSQSTGVIDAAITVGVWVHYAMAFSSGTLSYYKNGELTGTIPASWAVPTGHLLGSIGSEAGIDASYFDGLIDEVRIYTQALSASEIAALYAAI